MKKIGLVALFALLLAGCDDGGEKKAQENLRKAEAALEKENFNEAKLQIDSIRILYPKAFEARKQGVKLMQQVDLKEQRKSLIYLDSMMVVKQAQLDSVKGNFVLEKDTAYQEVGNYFYPTGRQESQAHPQITHTTANTSPQKATIFWRFPKSLQHEIVIPSPAKTQHPKRAGILYLWP